MNLSVPNEKFNIAILGDKTTDTAMRLLSLHKKRSTSLIQARSEILGDAEASKLFSIWEQNENPGKLQPAEPVDGIFYHQHFLDMNDLKEKSVQTLQSCAKVVECPSDTALVTAQGTPQTRKFLNDVMNSADLIIVDVDKELLTEKDGNEFSESRLAGLIRQHSDANYIFTVQIPSHLDEEQSSRLKSSLDR